MSAATLCSASGELQVTHEDNKHVLIITTRYTEGMEQSLSTSELADLTQATVRAWYQAWSAYVHNKDISDKAAPCDVEKIARSMSDPYVTVWNKNPGGVTLTVNSSEKPHYAALAGAAQALAIKHIREALAGSPDKGTEDKPPVVDKPDFKPMTPMNDTVSNPFRGMTKGEIENLTAKQLAMLTGQPDTDNLPRMQNWKHAVVLPNGSVLLPMKKDDDVRMAIMADKPIKYDELQYEPKKKVAYPIKSIRASVVGESNIPVIAITTRQYGALNIFKFKPDSDEEKNIDYSKLCDFFSRVNIDAEKPDFEMAIDALMVVEINHDEKKNKTYHNFYGFWNE